MNRPSAVGHLYRFVTRSNPAEVDSRRDVAEATNKAALMREATIKSAIFVGVPRVSLPKKPYPPGVTPLELDDPEKNNNSLT